MVTLNEVAAAAGVSYQTVTRVIDADDSVRPATRERVQAVIDRMDYRPDEAARALQARQVRRPGRVEQERSAVLERTTRLSCSHALSRTEAVSVARDRIRA